MLAPTGCTSTHTFLGRASHCTQSSRGFQLRVACGQQSGEGGSERERDEGMVTGQGVGQNGQLQPKEITEGIDEGNQTKRQVGEHT